jgi:hypothetical protein
MPPVALRDPPSDAEKVRFDSNTQEIAASSSELETIVFDPVRTIDSEL